MFKRFLLVLDDVWEEEERDKSKWGNVLAPLASGSFGSKILVTTRTESVALMFQKVIQDKQKPMKLEGLKEEECLELLNTHAFAEDDLDDQRKLKLKSITAEIVKKLSGSPLAAKVIGGDLNSNLDEGHWIRVLDSVLEIIKLGQNYIMPILKLSYIHLPEHLKSCFTFSSIFPQDYQFHKGTLVRQWIASGFIQPSHVQGEILEDIGGRYFDVLVKKNFFDKFEDIFGRYYYKMHDLIHELAQFVSMHECLRVEDSTNLPSPIPKTLRHLSVQDICALSEIFKLRSLRLLYIEFPKELKIIPEEIENLIHLRYLKIDGENLTMLQRSVSNLYHLQYIIHDGQEKDADFLPSDINNLSNLRYVKLPKNCISSICGIGKLKFLQKVNMFDLREASGYRIKELENMNDLCKLGINCLENVKDAEEACSAKLYAKRRLIDLSLNWSCIASRNTDLDENVLDNIQPPNCLRNLEIHRYMGARPAIWMNNVNLISNLEKINLTDCLECETLPPFGQLPFLKSLTLENMPKVKWLESKFNGNDKYHAFPLLEDLCIRRLAVLEDWFEAGVAAEDGCLFPCLIELTLVDCPKLKELHSLPPKLNSLHIYKIGWTTLNFCSNSNPIPLFIVNVICCPNITSLPLADEIARLAALRYLIITECPNLISLGRYREVETTNNCRS
ncbi:putative disease resistance protein RGA3 [Dendrobium catenatum]|uniref:putative disease resistance protein RGA3 n=1 Tax=Dendrobium catenatum TaxID=906689 RepID=UPI00109FB428|nr:putative disease resistance protein RGA3 [Dendrobium catenatum]